MTNRFNVLDTNCPASLNMAIRADTILGPQSDPELEAVEAALKEGAVLQDQLADLNPLVEFARDFRGQVHVGYAMSLEKVMPGLVGYADILAMEYGDDGGTMSVLRRGKGLDSMLCAALAALPVFEPIYEFTTFRFGYLIDGRIEWTVCTRDQLHEIAGGEINAKVKALATVEFKPSPACLGCPGLAVCEQAVESVEEDVRLVAARDASEENMRRVLNACSQYNALADVARKHLGETVEEPAVAIEESGWLDEEKAFAYLKRNVKGGYKLFADTRLKPVAEVREIIDGLKESDFKRTVNLDRLVKDA